MNEKRYYSRWYEEEYYILDSKKISEEEFDEKLEIQGYKAFEDSLTCKEVVDLLNENELLHQKNNELNERLKIKEKECVQIKQTIRDAMENERTHIGYNTLKQLMESLE